MKKKTKKQHSGALGKETRWIKTFMVKSGFELLCILVVLWLNAQDLDGIPAIGCVGPDSPEISVEKKKIKTVLRILSAASVTL